MSGQKAENPKKKMCVGLLAHVDAGKTTLAENILYQTGSIRKLGRVDHQDAFLDTDAMERARGITIFSKQAQFALGDCEITLLDTPGHVDFSAEMERTLQILDYAVLVISGADGVQGHVETLWRLLRRYRIPVFLFVNKMDQEGTDVAQILAELQHRLDERCVAFSDGTLDFTAELAEREIGPQHEKAARKLEALLQDAAFGEAVAMCDEAVLDAYLENGRLTARQVTELIAARKLFPCFFGSALKGTGVAALLEGLRLFCQQKQYPEAFGARVFKITRDAQGSRLTHLKVTGGRMQVKMLLSNRQEAAKPDAVWEEKADQLRVYDGAGYQMVQEAAAGSVLAVTGLTRTYAGQGLGTESEPVLPILEPVLTYRIILPEGCDVHQTCLLLKQLEEEEPELSIVWQERTNEIHAQVMGEVQMEVLKGQIQERFGIAAAFGDGSIVYKETIAKTAEGVGHFEPLRHYAEVHLILEPLEPGAGLQFATTVSEDELDRNWQRLVLTHLEEKKHPGVLTGSEITDMKITLAAGRAHLKHTEGGDFRQATYRALRQGLRRAKSVLLEPVYSFRLEVPVAAVGRAMTDVQKMQGSFEPPQTQGEFAVLSGSAPVITMRGYAREVTAYTKGRGRLACTLKGYEPCHNAEEVIAAIGYDPEADTENPTGSVFCAHGAGFVVPWDQVEQYMHLECCLKKEKLLPDSLPETGEQKQSARGSRQPQLPAGVTEKELEEIFTRTYGGAKQAFRGAENTRMLEPTRRIGRANGVASSRRTDDGAGQQNSAGQQSGAGKQSNAGRQSSAGQQAAAEPEYLLVDGYNIIFSWEELRELAQSNIEGARNKLMDILSNYQGFHACTLILVFDAYRVEGGQGSIQKYHNIHVIFTKEAETADQYIEKTVHQIGRKYRVTVATSDALEQVIIYGQGARRLSARELAEEVARTQAQIREIWDKAKDRQKNYLFDHLSDDLTDLMEEVRLGKKEIQ